MKFWAKIEGLIPMKENDKITIYLLLILYLIFFLLILILMVKEWLLVKLYIF